VAGFEAPTVGWISAPGDNLSIFLTAGIDGLVVDSNEICPQGPGTDTKISSIFVVSDRNSDRHYCRNVRISNNTTTTGSGISIIGAPAENNVVEGNQHMGPEEGIIACRFRRSTNRWPTRIGRQPRRCHPNEVSLCVRPMAIEQRGGNNAGYPRIIRTRRRETGGVDAVLCR
jgi:hypothetical protein